MFYMSSSNPARGRFESQTSWEKLDQQGALEQGTSFQSAAREQERFQVFYIKSSWQRSLTWKWLQNGSKNSPWRDVQTDILICTPSVDDPLQEQIPKHTQSQSRKTSAIWSDSISKTTASPGVSTDKLVSSVHLMLKCELPEKQISAVKFPSTSSWSLSSLCRSCWASSSHGL